MPGFTRLTAAAFVAALALASALSAACGGDEKPAATAAPASAGTPASASTPASAGTPASQAAATSGYDDSYYGQAAAPAAVASPVAPAATAAAAAPTRAATFDTPAVSIEDNSFGPAVITVAKGTKVTWTWNGARPHSVTGSFNGAAVNSPVQTSGAFSFTFDAAGTFTYQCGVHGASMAAKVIVQ